MNETEPDGALTEETAISEITIAPNGQVLVFGSSLEVLEALHALWPQDRNVANRLAPIQTSAAPGAPDDRSHQQSASA